MPRSKLGSVSVHEGQGVQARYGGPDARSKWFSLSQFDGSVEAAKAAALAWLGAIRPTKTKAHAFREKASASKTTDLMAGVSCSRYHDRRRGLVNIRFQVLYYVGERRRIKSFWLGPADKLTADDYANGRSVAEACRRAFLRSQYEGRGFDIEAWSQWRQLFGVETSWKDGRSAVRFPEVLQQLAGDVAVETAAAPSSRNSERRAQVE